MLGIKELSAVLGMIEAKKENERNIIDHAAFGQCRDSFEYMTALITNLFKSEQIKENEYISANAQLKVAEPAIKRLDVFFEMFLENLKEK